MSSKKLTIVRRSVLGLMFVAGPVATALHLAPEPALPPGGMAFMAALSGTGYMFPLLWCAEIAAGILLLSGFMVPFALVLLAPVILNIAAFHAFLAPNAVLPAILACALELFLAWDYRAAFAPLFQSASPQREATGRELTVRAA